MAIKVLVVEDDPGIQHVFKVMYELLGCEVVTCATQATAEDELAKGGFQIVHLDDNLTRMSPGSPRPHQGSRILAPMVLEKGYRVVGCSAEDTDEKGNPLWPQGVMVLVKPVSLESFQRIVGPMIASLGS